MDGLKELETIKENVIQQLGMAHREASRFTTHQVSVLDLEISEDDGTSYHWC